MKLRRNIATRNTVTLGISVLLLISFMLWYRPGEPLSSNEQQHYLQAISELSPELQNFIKPDVVSEFMSSDDGSSFFVINLFRFKGQADAGTGLASGTTGQEAFARFSRSAIPLWLRYGTHPVFATRASEAFSEDWDVVSVVRYRSRRDFMEIQVSPEFHEILPLRLAATEENIRIKLPGTLVPPPLLILVTLSLAVIAVAMSVPRRKPKVPHSPAIVGDSGR